MARPPASSSRYIYIYSVTIARDAQGFCTTKRNRRHDVGLGLLFFSLAPKQIYFYIYIFIYEYTYTPTLVLVSAGAAQTRDSTANAEQYRKKRNKTSKNTYALTPIRTLSCFNVSFKNKEKKKKRSTKERAAQQRRNRLRFQPPFFGFGVTWTSKCSARRSPTQKTQKRDSRRKKKTDKKL